MWCTSLDAEKCEKSNACCYFEIGGKIKELWPNFEGQNEVKIDFTHYRRHKFTSAGGSGAIM